MKKIVTHLLILSILIAAVGCSSQSRTKKGAAIGAAAGAAAGALIGKASGNTVVGAIVGAAVGGAAVFSGLLDEERGRVTGALEAVGLRVEDTRSQRDANGDVWLSLLTRR